MSLLDVYLLRIYRLSTSHKHFHIPTSFLSGYMYFSSFKKDFRQREICKKKSWNQEKSWKKSQVWYTSCEHKTSTFNISLYFCTQCNTTLANIRSTQNVMFLTVIHCCNAAMQIHKSGAKGYIKKNYCHLFYCFHWLNFKLPAIILLHYLSIHGNHQCQLSVSTHWFTHSYKPWARD